MAHRRFSRDAAKVVMIEGFIFCNGIRPDFTEEDLYLLVDLRCKGEGYKFPYFYTGQEKVSFSCLDCYYSGYDDGGPPVCKWYSEERLAYIKECELLEAEDLEARAKKLKDKWKS